MKGVWQFDSGEFIPLNVEIPLDENKKIVADALKQLGYEVEWVFGSEEEPYSALVEVYMQREPEKHEELGFDFLIFVAGYDELQQFIFVRDFPTAFKAIKDFMPLVEMSTGLKILGS